MANPSREVWWCHCERSKLAETPWSDFRQNVEFWPTSAFSCSACSPANRLPAESVCRSTCRHPGRLTTYKGFVRPLMDYSPLVWSGAAACHLSQLDRIQRRALSFLGPDVIVDSLELRRTISGLCLLYKLMCGPRSPCLLSLLPRQANHTTHPRTRQQAQVSSGHNLQFSLTLPPRSNNTILRSFSHALIPTWNSLPSSILHEQPHLPHLQRFKTATYRYLRKDWPLWATQTYV